MPHSLEIEHYARLIADLTIAAGRATNAETLGEVRSALIDAHVDVLTLIDHDVRGRDLLANLNDALAGATDAMNGGTR